jgi:hypothetical protein
MYGCRGRPRPVQGPGEGLEPTRHVLGAEAKGVMQSEQGIGGLAPALLLVGRADELANGPGSLAGHSRYPGPGPGGVAIEDSESAGAPRYRLRCQPGRLDMVAE